MTAYTTPTFNVAPVAPDGLNGVVPLFAVHTLTAALAAADTIDFFKLPAKCKPMSLTIAPDDLDSGTTATYKVGIYDPTTGNPTSDDDVFVSTSATMQTGAAVVAAHSATNSFLDLAAVDYDRYVRLTMVAGPTTASTGKVRALMTIRANDTRI